MGACILTLHELGWKPAAPDRWQQGEKWWAYTGGDPEELLEAIRKDISQKLWKKAAEHIGGEGLQGGADFTVARRYLGWLRRKGKVKEAGLLQTILAGGMWTRKRRHEAGYLTEPVCARCGRDEETGTHLIWNCQANEQIEQALQTRTKELRRAWIEGDQKFNKECFWERGLVPAEWTQVRAPTDEHLEVDVGDISTWGGGWYFSDGSGGQHTKDPRMRRCGWSLVQLRNHSTQEYSAQGPPTSPEVRIGAWGALGGKKQTVPRAELFCVLRLLQRTREVEDKIVLWVDCSYVQEGMQKLKKMQRGANADLWQEILEEINARTGLFLVRRVWKSHVTGKDIAAHCISRSHAWGNAAADAMAGEGAKLHQITPAEHTTITEVDKLAWQVLQRAVLVYTDILEKGEADIEGTTCKPERTTKTTEEKLHDIRKCGHKLYFEKGCWRFSGCRKGVRGADLTEWAESK